MVVLTLILFKLCSCFSLVLCPHFVGYHLLHIEHIDSNLGNFSAKISFGENSDGEISVRWNFRSAKFPFGKISVRRKFHSAKLPSAKILSAKIPSAHNTRLGTVLHHLTNRPKPLITPATAPGPIYAPCTTRPIALFNMKTVKSAHTGIFKHQMSRIKKNSDVAQPKSAKLTVKQ